MMVALQAVHPVLASSDVEASIAFFGRLGFTLRFKDVPVGPKYAAVRRDEVELHIQWATPDQWVEGLDRPAYRILVADVDALFEEFLKAGGIDADPGHRSPRLGFRKDWHADLAPLGANDEAAFIGRWRDHERWAIVAS